MYAEKLYKNGKFYTMEQEGQAVEAVGVRDGKIVFTGTNEEAEKIESDEIIDIKGRAVFPGFIDCHQHTLAYARTTKEVNLVGTKSVQDILDRLKERAKVTPPGDWIKGSGFNHEEFDEVRIPTKEELDSVSKECPILISRYCMHVHAANSKALEIAGIDENFKPIVPDSVEYGADGKPNGILRESAVTPVLKSIPDLLPTPEDKKDALEVVCRDMNRYGITGIHPIQGKFVDADEYMNLYQELEEEGRLPVRVYLSFDEYPSFHMKTGFGNEKLRYGFYKIYSDGSLGSRNAALTEDYSDDPGNKGLLNHSPEEVMEMCQKAYDMDLQIGIHAIGDRGVEIALDALENCYRKNPKPNVRFRLIHGIVLRKDLIERIKKMPIIVDIQPRFTSNYNIWWSEDRLGPERIRYAYAWNTLIKEGIILTGKMWGIMHEGVNPDVIVSGKGLSGGIYPVAATIMTKQAGKWVEEIGRSHTSTFGGSELGCVVANKVVEMVTRKETVDNVHFLEGYLKKGLDEVHKLYPDFFTSYTQRGIIFGLEFDFENGGQHAMRALFNNGIWAIYARFNPKIVQFKPGLLCTKEYCDELLEKFEKSVKEAKETCAKLK